MSAEDYLFTESGNLTGLIRTTTVDNHHLPGAATSQSNRDRNISSQPSADERRLFPGYIRKGEEGVPIKPTPSRSTKPPDYSIKPQNTLSSNRPSTTRTPASINRPQLQTTAAHTNRYKRGLEQTSDIEETSSLQKRSRTEKSQPKPPDVIEIEDSDDHSHAGGWPLSLRETYGRRFENDPAPATYHGGVPEYRQVYETVDPRPKSSYKKSVNKHPGPDFDEEGFMHDARKERYRKMSKGTREPKRLHGLAFMKSVEICDSNTGRKETTLGKGGQSGQDKDAAMHRDSSAHESPDELQGETTIGKPVSRSSRSPIAPRSDASPQRGNMPPSQISPGSFTKIRKETRSKSLRKGPKASGNGAEREFNLKVARFQNQRYDETTHPDGGVLTIGESDILIQPKNREMDREKHEVAIQHISGFFRGVNPSSKVRLLLRKTANTEASGSHLDLEFTSEKEQSDFILALQNHRKAAGINPNEKDCVWMDRAFKRSENETARRQATGFKRSSPENKTSRKEIGTKPETRKRAKLNESLQDEGENTKGNAEKHDGNKLCARPDIRDADDYGRKSQLEPPGGGVKTRRNVGSDIGHSKLHDSSLSAFLGSRETRSKARMQTAATTISGDEKQASPSRVNEPISKWSKPLVYPPIGKRKAEVEAHDLERLRDHEFLNDNLVGLYLRFLEHHLERANPDLANRIYVFNSYFFASLTNTPRGTRGINYHAVSKWTRLVDIFSRDYVVVPINENAHWYVAIICNLPQLRRQLESDELETPASENEKIDTSLADAGGDVSNIPKSEPTTEPDGLDKEASKKDTPPSDGDEQHTRKDLASLTLSDQKEEVPLAKEADSEKEDWPEDDENPISSASNIGSKPKPESEEDKVKPPENQPPSSPPVAKATSTQSKKPPRKSTGPPIRKYDEKQPIIITFDSLGCSRSPTITILRDYLEEEGRAKRSMKINRQDILGMTAKAIPEQPNYSDCGLYLLAYLEKFAQDPDEFIRKLLKREMHKKDDWPKMESRVLRKRLREFLINLHDEQEDTDQEKGSEKSSMVDAQPLEILLKPREKSTKDTFGDSTIASSTRGSPFAPEKDQSKTAQHTLASPSPRHITDTLDEKLSSLGRETEDPVMEEIPCTPSEASPPISSTEVHEATEPQVPGTPDAPSRNIKIIEGTPSPCHRSSRHSHNRGKQSPSKSAKVSNEHVPEQSESRDFMDELFSSFL